MSQNNLIEKGEKKLSDPLISNFLNDKSNYRKYKTFLESPNDETKKELDTAFKNHYKKVKVISYIDKLIYYYSIDLVKKNNRYHTKHALVLDKPVGNSDNMTIKDNLVSKQPSIHSACRFSLEELLADFHLYEAWKTLTLKHKTILTLKYEHNLKDVDIAEIMKVSKQVVSYNHKKAIKILKEPK